MPDSTATRYSSEAAQPVESWGNADRRSWLSMPFPLVLWLLIAPLILVVGSSGFGSSRSQTYSDRARVDDRGEVKPGFGTLPRR